MRPRLRHLITDHGRHLQVVTLTSRRQTTRRLTALTPAAPHTAGPSQPRPAGREGDRSA